MSIGQYRFKVTIQRNTPTTDSDYNTPVDSWATLREVFGKLTFLSGREGLNQRGLQYVQTVQLETWYKNVSDVTSKDRILYNSEYYDIQNVQPFQERNYCVITAEKSDQNE